MAQNTLPRQPGALLVLTGKCEAGLTAYATPLNITQITAASLAADAGALSTAMGDFNATRANRTAAHAALQAASAAAKTFLTHGRNVLAAHWGNDYSQNWASAGWTNNTTAVPNTQPERLALVGTLGVFLAANTSYAVNAPPIVFTAAQATSVGAAFQAGMDAVGAADTGADTAREARAAAEETLRKDLRALIGILNLKLTPNDARWAAFGLNAPGAAVTPKAPTNVQSFPALAGQIHATCDVPSGTDHFRWFVRAGADGMDLCDGHGGRGSAAHRADERADRAVARDGGEPGGRERAQRGGGVDWWWRRCMVLPVMEPSRILAADAQRVYRSDRSRRRMVFRLLPRGAGS